MIHFYPTPYKKERGSWEEESERSTTNKLIRAYCIIISQEWMMVMWVQENIPYPWVVCFSPAASCAIYLVDGFFPSPLPTSKRPGIDPLFWPLSPGQLASTLLVKEERERGAQIEEGRRRMRRWRRHWDNGFSSFYLSGHPSGPFAFDFISFNIPTSLQSLHCYCYRWTRSFLRKISPWAYRNIRN